MIQVYYKDEKSTKKLLEIIILKRINLNYIPLINS